MEFRAPAVLAVGGYSGEWTPGLLRFAEITMIVLCALVVLAYFAMKVWMWRARRQPKHPENHADQPVVTDDPTQPD